MYFLRSGPRIHALCAFLGKEIEKAAASGETIVVPGKDVEIVIVPSGAAAHDKTALAPAAFIVAANPTPLTQPLTETQERFRTFLTSRVLGV